MNIGPIIKKRRQHLNLSQEELALKLNVSRSAISNWEIGRNYPDIQTLVYLADELHLSLDQLLKQDEVMTKSLSLAPKIKRQFKLSIGGLVFLLLLVISWAVLFYPPSHPTIKFVKQTVPPEGRNSSGLVPIFKDDIQEIRFDKNGSLSVQFTTTNEEGVGAYFFDGNSLEIDKNESHTSGENQFDAVVTVNFEKQHPPKQLDLIVK